MDFCLTKELVNHYVIVKEIKFKDLNDVIKLNNIGLYLNTVFFVKQAPNNKKMIHIIVNNIEYVLRAKDAKNIIVSIVN